MQHRSVQSLNIYIFPEKPNKPSLSLHPPNPIEGQPVTLTCISSSQKITSYTFLNKTIVIAEQAVSSFTIKYTKIGADDVNYSCKVSSDGFKSEVSSKTQLNSKLCSL